MILRTDMIARHTIGQDYVKLSSRRPARAQAVPVQGNYPPHNHEYYEICVVTAGRALHRAENGDVWIQRGSVVIVAPGQTHAFARAAGFGVVNVYYLAEWFLSELQGLRSVEGLVDLFFSHALFTSRKHGGVAPFQLTEEELRACLHDLSDLQTEWESKDSEPLFCEAALLKCMIRLSRATESARNRQNALHLPRPVVRAITLIEQAVRTANALELPTVARQTGVSASHLCRLFRAQTGLSPGGYFQRLRIQRACRALLSTKATAAEVAHSLGYADSSHFNRSFKAITAATPCEYRRKFSLK